MVGHKKKTKNLFEHDDEVFERSIDELAEAIAEESRESYTNKLEPFEVYAERARMKLHENFNQFRRRFSRGYRLLLEEIKKDHENSQKNKHK